jgi:hypothetical protein
LIVVEKFDSGIATLISIAPHISYRAGDGIRTHDVSLGKAAFYH